MTPATRFRMASHSKLFTATSIMQLWDQGRLRLDDPVSKYLPWFQVKPAAEDDPPITIEELLTHSSGLPREAGSHWSDYNFPDEAGVRQFLAEHQATYSPEVRWKYSNLALTLAGLIVEKVSGESYRDYVQKHIFDPLEMTESSVDKNVRELAVGYGRRMPDGSRKIMPFIDAHAMAPATGVTSSVEDMAKFVSLQFRTGKPSGAQILSTAALREMHRIRMMESTWTTGNAIGFIVVRDHDRIYVGHGGSYPGYQTQTMIQLDDKVGVIVLTNADDGAPSDLAKQLMQTVGEVVVKAAKQEEKRIAWDPSWSRFAGLYRSSFGDTDVVETNQHLVTLNPASPTLVTNRLVPLGGGEFRLEAATGGGAVGEVVRFAEENGKVVRMYIGGSYSLRQGTN
jgi:D-alanyl-D-alanine carboxypeptidase